MKKMSFFALIMLGIGIILFHACGKEYSGLSNLSNSNEQFLKDSEMNSEEELIFQKLLLFKHEIDTIHEDETYVSNKTFSKDSACWYMEIWFNLCYCQTDNNYPDTYRDSLELNLNLDDLDVSMNELAEKIDTLYQGVYDLFEEFEAEEKEAYLIWVDKKEVLGSNLKVKIMVVFGIEPIISQWEPFGEDDDWLYGYGNGKCYQSGYESDAAEEIEDQINLHRPSSPPPPGYIFIYIIDQIDYILYGDEYANPQNPSPCNYLDYLIYYCTTDNCTIGEDEMCLEDDEMNFYYFGEYEVIHSKLKTTYSKPDNWVNKYADIIGLYEELPNKIEIIHHNNFLKYAYRFLQPIGSFNIQPISNVN